jgi:hypothetical protein
MHLTIILSRKATVYIEATRGSAFYENTLTHFIGPIG